MVTENYPIFRSEDLLRRIMKEKNQNPDQSDETRDNKS